MSKQKQKLISDIKKILVQHGYKEDRWGNYIKTNKKGVKIRYRFRKIVFKMEMKVNNRWVMLWSGYYKNIKVVNGKINVEERNSKIQKLMKFKEKIDIWRIQ